MDWVFAGPVIGGVAFMLITSATILLWPASRRLGHLLELMIQEKSRAAAPHPDELRDALQRIENRLERLEEGQGFAAALSGGVPARPPQLESPRLD